MLKPHEKEHETAIVKRKRGGGHDEGHGGAWKVAFADFCLALLSLFLVLWLMAARQQESLVKMIKETSSGQITGPGKKPEIAGAPQGSLIERFPTQHDGTGPGKGGTARVSYDTPQDMEKLKAVLVEMSKEAGLGKNLEAVVTPSGLRVMLHDTDNEGMFVRGSPLPTPRVARLLRKMGPLFEQMENQMLLVGHTDSVQYAAEGAANGFSNWTLSSNRALAARSELMAGGMRAESVLQVVGMADRAPLNEQDTRADINRRIEMMILTHAQSSAVAAMFGPPGKQGASGASARDDAQIEKLRRQLAK
ncbi:MAG TPA: flagellar motor protein MotB [Telluria sp.]|nr:flagellar motor protein MotB [Telluria sp.]